jgi:ORF6N domain
MKAQIMQDCICAVSGERLLPDFDLVQLYRVETGFFNHAVKRNLQNFPKDLMFRLTAKERKEILSSQFEMTDNSAKSNSSQFVMRSVKHRSVKYLPYALTEHCLTMLGSILKSPKAEKCPPG